MSDRFDLEQQMFKCWEVVEDLKTLANQYPTDNILYGKIRAIERVYDMRFENMWNIFEDMVHNEHKEKNEEIKSYKGK